MAVLVIAEHDNAAIKPAMLNTVTAAAAIGGHGGGDEILAQELSDSMLNGTPPSVGLNEGMVSAIACFAIDEAMDNGTVVDVTDWWKKAGM